jgi:lipoprotein signal peptidase
MEDSFFSVILIILQNALHQHFVDKEKRAQPTANWLGLFNLGMSFSTTSNSSLNLWSLTEHVFLVKRFLLHNPIE